MTDKCCDIDCPLLPRVEALEDECYHNMVVFANKPITIVIEYTKTTD